MKITPPDKASIEHSHALHDVVLSTIDLFTRQRNLNESLEELLGLLSKLLEPEIGHVFFPSQLDSKKLLSSDIWYFSTLKYSAFRKETTHCEFGVGKGIPGEVFEKHKMIYISDLPNHKGLVRVKSVKALGLKNALFVPLISDEKMVAILEFMFEKNIEHVDEIQEKVKKICEEWMMNYLNKVKFDRFELLYEAVQHSNCAILITNHQLPDQPIEYVNPAFEKLTGYAAREVLGKNCRFLQEGEQEDFQDLSSLKEAINHHKPCSIVLRNYKKNGELFWCDLRISPVFNEKKEATHYIGILTDVTENMAFRKQLEYQEKIEHQATHDSLTGLANRYLLLDRLRQAISDSERTGKKIAIAFVDLDNFKIVNDALGHTAGDVLLENVAKRLKSNLRISDTLSRVGGDEFIILINSISNVNGISVSLQKILSVISQPFKVNDQEIHVTCSIGLSIYPDDGLDPESLLKNADLAMYQAKEKGKNNFQFFTSKMQTKISQRLMIENGLRQALTNNEFYLLYQPKLDLKTNRLSGLEALIRWNHPEMGLVMPSDFIPVAEETGLIVGIGEWVIRNACMQNKIWQDLGYPYVPVSVNISPRQFHEENFVSYVSQVLDEERLAPQFLELELTETILMKRIDKIMVTLRSLKELGVKLSIDDFGTGYSSLSYLRQFPVDSLKIDQSFIRSLNEGPDAVSIIKAIVSLGHNLNLRVVAEGVETKEQFISLSDFNCDEIQGYYYSRPLSVTGFPEMFKKLRNFKAF